jgi:restriction endonuclease
MKVYASIVLDAVVECLRTVYWFQEDLRSFLARAGVPAGLVACLPWGRGTYKRTIARRLVDQLAAEPARGMLVIDKLIDSLVEMDEQLPHLGRLDDGKRKVEEGRQALRGLKELLGRQSLAERAERARQEARTEAERAREQQVRRQKDLAALNTRFATLCKYEADLASSQRRGFEFQKLLRDLFGLYDLEPRGSFAQPGEQVDGSIAIDGTFVIVEAKWEAKPLKPTDVRDFQGKLQTKLDNTLGLIISMSGFNDNAIQVAERSGRINVVLMDGLEITPIFEGTTDLTEVLRRKFRYAADYGRAMYRG